MSLDNLPSEQKIDKIDWANLKPLCDLAPLKNGLKSFITKGEVEGSSDSTILTPIEITKLFQEIVNDSLKYLSELVTRA